MLRVQLKSKIHLARVTDANLNYEGSITIPEDLMQAVDLWPGERVLVVSPTNGARLETYAQPGPAGSGAIIINGAAARQITTDDRVTLMAFCQAEEAIEAKKVICNEHNEVIKTELGVHRLAVPQSTISF